MATAWDSAREEFAVALDGILQQDLGVRAGQLLQAQSGQRHQGQQQTRFALERFRVAPAHGFKVLGRDHDEIPQDRA
jgi:hypothetical protein